MERYKVTYKDCGEISSMRIKAHDMEHAEEKFWDSIEDWQGDHRGIEFVSIQKVKKLK